MRPHTFAKGEFYHIYVHGIGNLEIFREDRDYNRFLSLLFSSNTINPTPRLDRAIALNLVWDILSGEIKLGESLTDIICFCLMPTHFHLLLREREGGNISKYLHKILVSHSKYYNIKYERRGHLFESNFHSKHIDNNDYLLILSCYIHKNSKDLESWKNKEHFYPWSSYQDFVSQNRWQHLLKKDIIAGQFKNSEEYKNFTEEHYQDFDPNLV
ncbi:MAG: transposase [Patescibacteria group bacterium]